eukprot:TRINITY_DN80863_c0_g1_i1.p1 TRINITY_DN80863_c0_g1~~TRINITY_DN80863_c0_g1_i1.p1  ORF type:complete len:156 (+),score=17.12 TRINITY_DN80863_c0_g1_i1:58-468(+)
MQDPEKLLFLGQLPDTQDLYSLPQELDAYLLKGDPNNILVIREPKYKKLDFPITQQYDTVYDFDNKLKRQIVVLEKGKGNLFPVLRRYLRGGNNITSFDPRNTFGKLIIPPNFFEKEFLDSECVEVQDDLEPLSFK